MCKSGVALVWMVSVLLAAGCSDSDKRQASQTLLDKVAEAQQYFDRGLSLTSTPAIVVGGEFAPSDAVATTQNVTLAPAGTLNPKAIEALGKAQSILSAAVQESAGKVSPHAEGVARMMLGRIESQIAQYRAMEAAKSRNEARYALGRADYALMVAQAHATALVSINELASLKDGEVAAVLDKAKAEVASADAQIRDLEGQIQTLSEQRKQLSDEQYRLTSEADGLAREAREATPKEGMTMLEKAQALRENAAKAEARVSEIEALVDASRQKTSSLQVARSAADALAQVAAAVVESRRGSVADAEKARSEAGKMLATVKQNLTEMSAQAASSLTAAAAAENKAVERLGVAVKEFELASKLLTGASQMEALSQNADARLELVSLQMGRLRTSAVADAYAGRLKKVYADLQDSTGFPIQHAETIQGYLGGADAARSIREDVIKTLRDAIAAYGRADAMAPRELRWAYQGQKAAAELTLYSLTGEDTLKTGAATALAAALQGKENSPNLASIKRLQEMAESVKAPAPTP